MLIQDIDGNINYFVLDISKLDGSIIVNPLNTTNYVNPDVPPVSGMKCVTTTTEITTPCSCGHYDNCEECPYGNPFPVTRTVHKTTCYYVAPPEVTFSPPSFNSGSSSGNPSDGLPGIPSDQNPPPPIYIYEGEQECFSDGSCTLQLYWAYTETTSEIEQPIEITNDDPCKSLKKLLQPSEPTHIDIKPYINDLKTKTALKNEWSINFKKNPTGGEIFEIADSRGVIEGPSPIKSHLTAGTRWFGQIHTHPEGTTQMFSWLDLRGLKDLYNDASTPFKGDVFISIVNHNESVYAIKVNNLQALTTALQTDWDNAKGNTDKKKETFIRDELRNKYAENNNLEQTFLNKYSNHGISLFKATNTLDNWKQLTLDTNQNVTETPCN